MGTIIERIMARTGWRERVARIVVIAALFMFVIVILALVAGLSRCSSGSRQRAQGRVDAGQSGAFANSAADAVATQQNAAARERSSDELSRTNEEEIRNAQGANAHVDPAVRDAGLRSLCRRAAYRDSPRCKLLQPPAR